MARPPSLRAIQRKLARIAELTYRDIQEGLENEKWKLKSKEWKSVAMETRWSSDGNARIGKLRIQMANGKSFARLNISFETAEVVNGVGEMRNRMASEKWYGLRFTLSPDGKCGVTYNYDRHCALDPHFWDTD